MKEKQKLIYKSTDYSKFVQDDTNRDAGKHRWLLTSMKQYGWIPDYPAVVVPDGDKFRVKDGGHRITFAKQLKLPVFYVVTANDEISIPDVNRAQKTWGNTDYVTSFIKQGKEHYKRLQAFALETGMPVGAAAGLLNGGGISPTQRIRSGQFKVTNEEHARTVVAVVRGAQQTIKWANGQKFISAVDQILRHSRASAKVLADKIRAHPGMLIPQTTSSATIEMLENVYNYRNREPVAISLAVHQAVRAIRRENGTKAGTSNKK